MTLAFDGRNVESLGIAHDFEVDPHSGSAILTVPIPVPPGRGDLAPSLSLQYSATAANSAFGAGWMLSGLPIIAIDSRKRLPLWDGTDTFALGGDELVPWLAEVNGVWVPRGRVEGPWSIQYLRRRLGTARIRVEQWTHAATGRVHFRVRDASDAITIFGARPNAASRIADPEDETRTFAWLPEVQLDPHGNAMWFEYAPETIDGIDLGMSFERRRPALAQRYLKRIRYGNVTPIGLDDALVEGTLPDQRWCFQIVFDYGDHADPDQPSAEPDRPWPSRLDPFTNGRAGFEARTWRLCRRILSFHEFDELGPGPTLTGALILTHDESVTASTLREIGWVGHRRDGSVLTSKSVPSLRMTYAQPGMESGFQDVPAETQENLPVGLAGQDYAFVDLFGEGLPGILASTDRAWFYKPNVGGGRFGAQVLLPERPSADVETHGFGDLDHDGDTDYSQLTGRLAGYFELARETARWSGFRTFAMLPHLEGLGERAQWIDLNGDGRPDVLIAKDDSFVWFPSEGEGFSAPVEIPRPDGAGAIPSTAADERLDFFFADMNGDGIADLVRVENARVRYWPSLGNGRFGDAVELEVTAPLATDDEFNSARLRFVDLDGSGTADLLYIGRGEILTMLNAGGNRLVPGPRLGGLPYIDDAASLSVLDFLGDGRPCLVWSSALALDRAATSYLPLAPPVRPRLLVEVDNSLGRRTRITWSTSASHYLRDLHAGRSWSTRLPHHQAVVDAREVIDEIGGTRSVKRFVYHDGHYDGEERESRGFGQVDVYDDDLGRAEPPAAGGAAPALATLTRTWFHLGSPTGRQDGLLGTYDGDPDLATLARHEVEDESGLVANEVDDGLCALAGFVLRSETYAVESSGMPAAHPFSVHQARYRLRRSQPARGQTRAAFVAVLAESLSAEYEQTAGDPRITHKLIVETDAFDQPRREADISYPRRPSQPHDTVAQGRFQIAVSDHRLLNIDEDLRFELTIPIESKTYELVGVRPGSDLFTRAELTSAAVVAALASLAPHHVELVDDPTQPPRARRLSWDQSFYWNDARTTALPLGELGSRTMVHHEETASLSPGLVAEVFGPRVDDARLLALGYRLRDDHWWQADPVHTYAPAAQFSQRLGLEREDGAFMRLEYDADLVAIVATVDPMGNRSEAVVDYHLLAPSRLTDPNGNVSEVRYDPLGVIVYAANRGHVFNQRWGSDSLDEIVDRAPSSIAEAVADPAALLQGAASYLWYDLHAWTRDRTPTTQLTLTREALQHDGAGGAQSDDRIQIAIRYIDGFGRTLQQKMQVEAGPAIQRDGAGAVVVDDGGRPVLASTIIRWRASGHVAYDTKQRSGRVYEPFFSPTFQFEGDDVLRHFGASTLTHYDARDRVVRQDFDHGTFARTIYGPWSVEQWDANDTVLESTWRVEREGLSAADPEGQALEHAKRHAATPRSIFFDAAGREVATLERGGGTADDRRIEKRLDITGCVREVIDARGLVAFIWRHDMQGRVVFETSVDSGESRALADGHGRIASTWDARGFEIQFGYDRLDRQVFTQVRGGDLGSALDHRVSERVYGETLPDAAERNLRGRIATVRDGAGELTVDHCDPAGRALNAERRLRSEVDSEPDWRGSVPLEAESFTESSVFDALGRLRRQTLADGTERAYEYQAGGPINRIRVTTPGGGLTDVPILDGAAHDARGLRESVQLGNGVAVNFGYDPRGFRLVTQSARRDQRSLQGLAYTYDAAGKLVRLVDHAQQGADPVIAGATASARRDFVYDAHYRLKRATGRVHQALLKHDYVPGAPRTFKGTRHLSLNNGAAIEAFAVTYDYDAANNLRQIRHIGGSQSFTTDLLISTTSNRAIPALDLGGNPIVVNPESHFDAAGNVRQLDHLRRMEWRFSGSLSRAVIVERPGGIDDDERYVYGSDGMRVRKITTRVVNGGASEVIEKVYLGAAERKRIRVGGNTILERWTSHVTDGSGKLAMIHRWTVDTLARETDQAGDTRIHYLLETRQGSAALELDEQGEVISYEEYFPYGCTAFIAGNDLREVSLKEYRYCAKECDHATGLYYYGHRYYAPWMGRWLSPDPIGPKDDLNLYQFVRGDPVGNVDVAGLETKGGKIEYINVEPPQPAADIDGKIASKRASLKGPYRAGFDSLSRADQERYVTSRGFFLVPTDPYRPTGESGWSIISEAEFKTWWLPARQVYAKARGENVKVRLSSPNPSRSARLGGGGTGMSTPTDPTTSTATTGGGASPATSGDGSGGGGAGKSASGDGKGGQGQSASGDGTGGEGSDAKDTGDGNGKDKAGRGGGGILGSGGGQGSGGGGSGGTTDGQGIAGSGSGITGTGTNTNGADDGFGGMQGGQEWGEVGGTAFSTGHTPGGTGVSSEVMGIGAGGGAGRTRTGSGGQGPGGKSGDPSQPGIGGGGTGKLTPTPGMPVGAGGSGRYPHPSAKKLDRPGAPTGTRTLKGHEPGDKSGWDTVVEMAGVTNFVVDDDRPGGSETGVPGGLGWFGSNRVTQVLYVATSIIGAGLFVSGISGMLAGIVGLFKGLFRLGAGLLRLIPSLLRLGIRALALIGRMGSRMWSGARSLIGGIRNYLTNLFRFRRSAPERTWQDFLPEARRRVQAAKAQYGDDLMMSSRVSPQDEAASVLVDSVLRGVPEGETAGVITRIGRQLPEGIVQGHQVAPIGTANANLAQIQEAIQRVRDLRVQAVRESGSLLNPTGGLVGDVPTLLRGIADDILEEGLDLAARDFLFGKQ